MSFPSQPRTGINQKPLVFAQIRQGVSAPEISKARVVESSRVIDISSNRFLHLFYRKPHMEDMGYDHALDGLATFRVKTSPDARVPDNAEMLAAGALDVGDSKSTSLSERQFLTLSDCSSWEWKPSVKVADFFANSLGVPIECWTPCSRIQMARELEEADLIKFELECGAGESQDCAMTAGELAMALNAGDGSDFDPFDDLHGEVQLSVLFVNAHPDIQPLDFRLRMRIMRCECEPICYVSAESGKVIKVSDGAVVAKGDLARLGMNQTCLAVAFNQNNGTVSRTAMKYALFPSPPRCAFEYKQGTNGAEALDKKTAVYASAAESLAGKAGTPSHHLEVTVAAPGLAQDLNKDTAVFVGANQVGVVEEDAKQGDTTLKLKGTTAQKPNLDAIAANQALNDDAVGTTKFGDVDANYVTKNSQENKNNTDKRGMSNRLALQDVWCTRAGQVIGISRGSNPDDKGNRLPVFTPKNDKEFKTTDAAGCEIKAAVNEEHKPYNSGSTDNAAVKNAGKMHWRDYCHYAGENSGKWGAAEGKTVVLTAKLTLRIVNNASLEIMDEKLPNELFEDLKLAKDGEAGDIQDTSESGEEADALPDAVAERLI